MRYTWMNESDERKQAVEEKVVLGAWQYTESVAIFYQRKDFMNWKHWSDAPSLKHLMRLVGGDRRVDC